MFFPADFLSSLYSLRNLSTFVLRHRGHDRQTEFSIVGRCIDAIIDEKHVDPHCLQFTGIGQGIHRTVSTKYPLAQKCRLPYLYFRFACLSKIMRLLFPLRYPMT